MDFNMFHVPTICGKLCPGYHFHYFQDLMEVKINYQF
jgi:hypothetical protein